MSLDLTSPLSGADQTGFTSPTFTLLEDTAPTAHGKQFLVSAIGGTAPAAVDVHSISRPFTVTVNRPSVFKRLGTPNPSTGIIAQVPRNPWTVLTRKGVTPLSGQPDQIMPIKTIIPVVAGSDLADPENIRAALSLHIGALSQLAAALGDSCNNGQL